MRSTAFLWLLLCASIAIGQNPATIFVSRHADRYGTEPDPTLTPKGEEQARQLAVLLADAHVKHIFTTELIRTQQTAAPLAKQNGITPVVVPQDNFDALVAKVRAAIKPGESILVVGHRATVPKIVKALSGREIQPLGSSEYGRLIAVTIQEDGSASLLTLRYAPNGEKTK